MERSKIKTSLAAAPVSQVNLFSVPVMVFPWPEISYWRDDIIGAVEKRQRRTAGTAGAPNGVWLSADDFPSWPEAGVKALVRWAAAMASKATSSWRQHAGALAPQAWRMGGRARITQPAAADTPFLHHGDNGWNWSGIMDLDLPGGDASTGEVVFADKFLGIDVASLAEERRRTYRQPLEAGELVMFPSWLFHRLAPLSEPGRRVTVELNFHSPWLEPSRFHGTAAPRRRLGGRWPKPLAAETVSPRGVDIEPEPSYL